MLFIYTYITFVKIAAIVFSVFFYTLQSHLSDGLDPLASVCLTSLVYF